MAKDKQKVKKQERQNEQAPQIQPQAMLPQLKAGVYKPLPKFKGCKNC